MKTPPLQSQRGMTLIELMIALAIGLFLALAVTSVLTMTLRQQQTSSAVNSRDQNATQAIAQLDKTLRGAGSALSNGWELGIFGCNLHARKSGTTLLPASTLAAPFGSVSALKNPVAAPVVIEAGVGANDSDVLFVMSGNSASGDVARSIKNIAAEVITLDNVIDLKANDLLLIAAREGMDDCYISQVNSIPNAPSGGSQELLNLGGSYYAESIDGANATVPELVLSAGGAFATPIGNTSASYPTMKLIGAGDNAALYEVDLLQTRFSSPQMIGEGISHLFALYGVDTNEDGKVDSWQSPSDSSWTASAVMGSALKLRQIIAIRLAIVTRSSGVRETNISDEELTIFKSMGSTLQRDITLTSEQRAHRHRIIETVIPLRNNLMIEP